MVVLLAAMIPVVLISGVALFAPPVLDLVWRPERVPLWWGAPLLFLPVCLVGYVAVGLWVIEGGDRYFYTVFSFTWLHMWVAAALMWMSLALSLVRGLRPGGETARKRRTTVIALLALILGSMVLVFMPVIHEIFFTMMWVQIPTWVGLMWVIAMNRTGSPRLMNARRASAGWLVAAALVAWGGMAHPLVAGLFSLSSGEVSSFFTDWPIVWLVTSLGVTASLIVGLRVLTPVSYGGVVLGLASWCTLMVPSMAWRSFWPLPSGTEVPVWVDLRGWGGPPAEIVGRVDCLVIPKQSREVGPDCALLRDYALVAYPSDTPLSEVALSGTQRIVVDHGRYTIEGWSRWGEAAVIVEVEGRARILPGEETYELGPLLHERLMREYSYRPLKVVRTPNWTLQDFASICASTGANPTCSLVDEPGEPGPYDPPPVFKAAPDTGSPIP